MATQMTLKLEGALVKLELDKDSAKDLVKAAGMSSRAQAETALTWIRRGFRLRVEKGWGTNGVARNDEPVRTLMLELTSDDIVELDRARAEGAHGSDQRAVLLELMYNGSLWEWEGCEEDERGEQFIVDVTAARAALERQASWPEQYEAALDDLASLEASAGFEPIGLVVRRSLREAVQEVKHGVAQEDAA
ncbi:hypothetical protein [Roseiterribacter gracilis]|uniref:Uncharacterized protein n=1 Tax=Roseiterribacter gracilis TaxID=2812848 RepID=A0A8S8XDC1_9PROT|nr:hypothetical protein TMPK1_29110 [Rhodospirillales bacterium TMPK1]